jgi:hypothetical protein
MERSDARAGYPLGRRSSESTAGTATGFIETSIGAERNGTGPDAAYWTPYDYHMMEREARAVRRAHVYAAIARLARALYGVAVTAIRHARSTVVLMKQRDWTPSS